jgi:hypothetical protein
MEASVANIGMGEEIRPYKIHVSCLGSCCLVMRMRRRRKRHNDKTNDAPEQVSSKYLDLTRKKLELTRLPHELLLPRTREWEYGTPKAEIEPLIDFWYVHISFFSRDPSFGGRNSGERLLMSHTGSNITPGDLKNHTSTPRSLSSAQQSKSRHPA